MSIEASDRILHVQTEVITAGDLDRCAEITGELSERSLGIAFVLALRTIVASGALPPGAMMLGYDATWHEAPRPGAFRTEMRICVADPPRRRYQRVVIGYRTLAADDSRLVLNQAQEVLWPIAA